MIPAEVTVSIGPIARQLSSVANSTAQPLALKFS